jgi:hypothetical protein
LTCVKAVAARHRAKVVGKGARRMLHQLISIKAWKQRVPYFVTLFPRESMRLPALFGTGKLFGWPEILAARFS